MADSDTCLIASGAGQPLQADAVTASADYALSDHDLLAACRVDRFRSGGPGGQHASRTDSAVRLVHLASGAVTTCQDHREQPRNLMSALRAMRLELAATQRGGSDLTWLDPWRRQGRLIIGEGAEAYPRVAACLLDALEQHQGGLADAAATCGLTTSQLVRLLAAQGRIHTAANALRAAHGLGPMHVR